MNSIMINNIANRMVEGLQFEFEAIEGKITIIVGYIEIGKFKDVNTIANSIINDLLKANYEIIYDNLTSQIFLNALRLHRYVVLRPVKGDK